MSKNRVVNIGKSSTVKLFKKIIISACLFFTLSLPSYGLDLFTEDTANKLRLSNSEWNNFVTTSSSRGFTLDIGPDIQVNQPELKAQSEIIASSPTDLVIVFQGKDSQVDMSTLDIEIEKGWFSFSLTDKLSPYIDGNQLAAQKVDIPAGKYVIQITVKDEDGNKTEKKYKLKIE
jgi:hypothetical protein